MYKIKRFNVIQDLRHSGLSRTFKKHAGRARIRMSNKLNDNVESLSKSLYDLSDKIDSNKVVSNPSLTKKLLRKSNSIDTRVLGSDVNSVILPDSVTKSELDRFSNVVGKRSAGKLSNAVKGGKLVITHDTSTGAESLAHEIGHVMNAKGNIASRTISDRVAKIAKNKEINGVTNTSPKSIVSKYAKERLLELEESRASKKAMDLLKSNGATQEELKIAESNLKDKLDSYKIRNRLLDNMRMRNLVQIPSRRSKEFDKSIGMTEKTKESLFRVPKDYIKKSNTK